ncbi:MAG: hypothetical protein ABIH01_04545 [Candidatus Omnitrophota bacterium]
MIEINLLPEGLRKKPRIGFSAEYLKFDFAPALKRAVIVFAIVQMCLFAMSLFGIINVSTLGPGQKSLEADRRNVLALKDQEKTLNAKLSNIDAFCKKRFLWSRELNELLNSVTPGIWLTDISIGKESKGVPGRSFIIRGVSASNKGGETALISKFIHSLKTNILFSGDFSDIKIVSSNRDKVRDVDVMKFVIACHLKEN